MKDPARTSRYASLRYALEVTRGHFGCFFFFGKNACLAGWQVSGNVRKEIQNNAIV